MHNRKLKEKKRPLALIIGHTGQDGQLLRQYLSAEGHAIVGISTTKVNSWNLDDDPPQVRVGFPSIIKFIRSRKPEYIYYLAAHHQSSQDVQLNESETWQKCLEVHVSGFQQVLQAVSQSSSQTKVFYASSSRVFGRATTRVVNEESPLVPECFYGLTKLFGMKLAEYYRNTNGIHVSTGILFNHDSPLRKQNFVSQRIVNDLVAIKRGTVSSLELGDLNARVDWGYAGDYVRAMYLILKKGQVGDYVIASGKTHSVRDLVSTAAAFLEIDWQSVVIQQSGILTRSAQQLCGDSSKLTAMTGWRAETSFEEMIHLMIESALTDS